MKQPTVTNLKPTTETEVAQAIAQKAVAPKEEKKAEEQKPTEVKSTEAKPIETKVETKVETPKAEEKKEEPKVEEKPKVKKAKAADFLKNEIKPEEVKEVDWKAKASDYEKEIERYKQIESDTDIQALLEIKKSGGDIFKMLDEVRGEDLTKKGDRELWAIHLKEQGLSDELMEDALEDFDSKRAYEQALLVKNIRENLGKRANETKSQFLERIRANGAQGQAEKQKEAQAILKTQTEYQSLCDRAVGQEHYGLNITPQMAQSLKNILSDPNGILPKKEDGTMDSAALFDIAYFKLFKDLIIDNLQNQVESKTIEDMEKEIAVTSGSTAQTIRQAPATQQFKTEQERSKYLTSRLQPVN